MADSNANYSTCGSAKCPSPTSGSSGGGGSGGATTTSTPQPTSSGPTATTAPTPTLYPASTVSGNLYQDSNGSCNAYTGANKPALTLSPQSTTGVTTSCTVSSSTYTCTISYNNQTYGVASSQNFTLQANVDPFGSGSWYSGNTCGGTAGNTRTVAVGANNTGWNIYFEVKPWIKMLNSSFSGASFSTVVPPAVSSFDSDDPGNRYILDGNSPGLFALGTDLPASTSAPISKTNIALGDYSFNRPFTTSYFLSYVKSRKKRTDITSLSSITADGIYYYSGNLTISSLPNYNLVLIVDGNVTISQNLTQSTALAILATGDITVGNNVGQINAILATDGSFDSGTNTGAGLKIVGSVAATSFENNRNLTNNYKPSVFIVAAPQTNISLLPYLSIAQYEWRV